MTMQDDWDSIDISCVPDSILILIADHSAFARVRIKEILRNEPVRIMEVADGEDAWRILETTPGIQFVFCDANLPRLNGVGLLERLNKKRNGTSVAILSTETPLDLVLQAKKLGATAWLQKPLLASDMLDLIHRFMEPLKKAS